MAEIDRDKIFDEFLARREVAGWEAERYIGIDVLTRTQPRTVWARQHAHNGPHGPWVELPPGGFV